MDIYAQLNDQRIATAISQLSGSVDSQDMIALEYLDSSLIGKRYEDGKWIAPPEPEPVSLIPQSVTMRQARQAMLSAGILSQVDALIAAMPGDEGESARIDWNHAQEVKRDWPLIGALGPQMGLTEQQIDDLFIYAATIPQ